MWARRSPGSGLGVSSNGSAVGLDDHVVVAERVPLLEVHAGEGIVVALHGPRLRHRPIPLLVVLLRRLVRDRAACWAIRAERRAGLGRRSRARVRRELLRQRRPGDRGDPPAGGLALRRRPRSATTPTPSTRSSPSWSIAGSIELFGDGPFAWRIGSLVFGTLAILGMFALVRAAGGGPWTALGAARADGSGQPAARPRADRDARHLRRSRRCCGRRCSTCAGDRCSRGR